MGGYHSRRDTETTRSDRVSGREKSPVLVLRSCSSGQGSVVWFKGSVYTCTGREEGGCARLISDNLQPRDLFKMPITCNDLAIGTKHYCRDRFIKIPDRLPVSDDPAAILPNISYTVSSSGRMVNNARMLPTLSMFLRSFEAYAPLYNSMAVTAVVDRAMPCPSYPSYVLIAALSRRIRSIRNDVSATGILEPGLTHLCFAHTPGNRLHGIRKPEYRSRLREHVG